MLDIQKKIQIDEVKDELFNEKNIRLFIARLDLIHPVVSGNKLYKLHYFFKEAKASNKNTIITFGGAYSNHLVATAYHSFQNNIKSIGIVRGEKSYPLSHTLKDCMHYNMELIFIPRSQYDAPDKNNLLQEMSLKYPDAYFIPEGGYHPLGSEGAGLIMNSLSEINPSHVCTAVGTATTLSGLIRNNKDQHEIIAVPVIKNMTDIKERLNYLISENKYQPPVIFDGYHFDGYAKKNETLLSFMNTFYQNTQIPTDFVYTGKMMYAVYDKIKSDYFPMGSHIVCIHTGGLQGNLSLTSRSLVF